MKRFELTLAFSNRPTRNGQNLSSESRSHKQEREKKTNFKKWSTTEKDSSQITCTTVNLPQLPLPTFSDDPKLRGEFWSSFNAAMHFQELSDIQKLNCSISCQNDSPEEKPRYTKYEDGEQNAGPIKEKMDSTILTNSIIKQKNQQGKEVLLEDTKSPRRYFGAV
uniref:Uncharacterized protein n=1 Tax=Loa loa TaxID=7209 RepID=A0A1I7W4D2_LOALO